MKNPGNSTFSLKFILHDDIVKKLNKLKTKKASQKTEIPIKIVKENVDVISCIIILIIRCHALRFQLA